MPLYRIESNKANPLKKRSFPSEKALQKLFETNLMTFLETEFIATEFVVNLDGTAGRIDTLGLDINGNPVIVEYKKTQNGSLLSQGLFYLNWLVHHKGDFERAVQKKLGKDVEVEWSSPRLVLVAESFGIYDIFAAQIQKEHIEMWEYRYVDGDIFHLEMVQRPKAGGGQVEPDGQQDEPVKKQKKEKEPKEIVTYTLEHHTAGVSESIKEVFDSLRENIFELQVDGRVIEEIYRKQTINYRSGKNFCEVHIYSNQITLWLDIPVDELNDPDGLSADASNKGHWGSGCTEVKLSTLDDVARVVSLIAQAYEYVS